MKMHKLLVLFEFQKELIKDKCPTTKEKAMEF